MNPKLRLGIFIVVGTALGTAAGYCGGAVDDLIMRVLDLFLAFRLPSVPTVLALTGVGALFWASSLVL